MLFRNTATEASFKVEISAVADAPTLKDADNKNLNDPTTYYNPQMKMKLLS